VNVGLTRPETLKAAVPLIERLVETI